MEEHFGKGICPGGASRLDHDHKHFHRNFQIPDNWGHTSNGEEKEMTSLSSEEESSQREKVKASPEKKKEEDTSSSEHSPSGTYSSTTDNKKDEETEGPSFSDVTGGVAVGGIGGTGLAAWGFGDTVVKYGNIFYQANPKEAQKMMGILGKKALERAGKDAAKVGKVTGKVAKGTVVITCVVAAGKIGYYANRYRKNEIQGKRLIKEVICASTA